MVGEFSRYVIFVFLGDLLNILVALLELHVSRFYHFSDRVYLLLGLPHHARVHLITIFVDVLTPDALAA